LPKTALVIATCAVALITFASPALAAPTASFTVSDGPYKTGQDITFTSTSTAPDGATITGYQWNIGGVAYTTANVTRSFQQPGNYQATLTVTTDELIDNTATTPPRPIVVTTRPPVADFTFSPLQPFINDDVLFAPDASDPDGDTLSYTWSWGDGTDDSHAHVPLHTFRSVGSKTVTLTVTDSHGAVDTVSHDVDVRGLLVLGNVSPHASFVASRKTVEVGDSIEFVSGSYDRDGSVKEQVWDLNGDGKFDDAKGDDVFYTFTTAGSHTVRLRATDNSGSSDVATQTITVKAKPKAKAGFLSPEPSVRLNGLIYSTGTRIQILGVRGPRGSLVTVRCRGKGCPVPQRRKRIKKRPVRFHNFERYLRAGIRIEIYVTKKGKIGDYTRYTIRRGKVPLRVDRCVSGARLKPVGCG
jgi:PKD repeat protein